MKEKFQLNSGDLRQPNDLLLLGPRQGPSGKQNVSEAADPRHARHAEQQDCDGPLPHSGENSEAGLSERVGS